MTLFTVHILEIGKQNTWRTPIFRLIFHFMFLIIWFEILHEFSRSGYNLHGYPH